MESVLFSRLQSRDVKSPKETLEGICYGLNCVSLQKVLAFEPPIPANFQVISLSGNGVFPDDQVKMGPGPNLVGWIVLMKRQSVYTETGMHTEGAPREDEGRNWGDAPTSQRLPATSRNREGGRGGMGHILPHGPRQPPALPTP